MIIASLCTVDRS